MRRAAGHRWGGSGWCNRCRIDTGSSCRCFRSGRRRRCPAGRASARGHRHRQGRRRPRTTPRMRRSRRRRRREAERRCCCPRGRCDAGAAAAAARGCRASGCSEVLGRHAASGGAAYPGASRARAPRSRIVPRRSRRPTSPPEPEQPAIVKAKGRMERFRSLSTNRISACPRS